MNGVPDGYVGSGVKQDNLSSVGVTPTNLARAYHPIEQGVAQPDGFQPQLQGDEQVIIRDRPDGFQPQTKTVASSTVLGELATASTAAISPSASASG